MTSIEFNEKWKIHISEAASGLQINDDKVIKYLDEEFLNELISNHFFKFSQIKIKFGTTRIYSNSYKNHEWEQAIDRILIE